MITASANFGLSAISFQSMKIWEGSKWNFSAVLFLKYSLGSAIATICKFVLFFGVKMENEDLFRECTFLHLCGIFKSIVRIYSSSISTSNYDGIDKLWEAILTILRNTIEFEKKRKQNGSIFLTIGD